MHYIGVDYHNKYYYVVVKSEDGRVPNCPETRNKGLALPAAKCVSY